MTLDLTRPHKRVEFTIKISSNRQATINGGEEFFTMDSGGTAVGIFNFELEDENGEFKKLDLTDVKEVLIGFDFTVARSSVVLEADEILDVENGRVALVLPNQFEYSGPVLGYTYIIWKDGREQDGGEFQLTFTESWLDKELPEMEDFYVKRFEDLAEEIRRRVEEIKAEMDKELKVVKQDITTAQSDINRIQQQINDNDIVRQSELDSAGFGENNLIRNSAEPIIINPAGNYPNVPHELYRIKHGEAPIELSLSCDTYWLRGGTSEILIATNSGHATGGHRQTWRVKPVNGKLKWSGTINPNTIDNDLVLVIYAGNVYNGAQGNTLKITNPMLTRGTKSQPYRPAHEDNTKRLDNIEMLKPNVKRTVATFEGKVTGRVVENPHTARGQINNTLAAPNSNVGWELTQGDYESISAINGRTARVVSNQGDVCQHRLDFNVVEHLEKEHSTAIWQGHTALADKVRIARQIVKRIACAADVTGQTNDVPFVAIRIATSLTAWETTVGATHTNSIPQRLTRSLTGTPIGWSILSDGTVRYLVHTVENQTTPIGGASLTTAFVQFEVDVELTLAHTDYGYSKAEIDALRPTTAPLPLGSAPQIGSSGQYADKDHVHQMPTASQVGAVPSTGGTYTGDVTFNGEAILGSGKGIIAENTKNMVVRSLPGNTSNTNAAVRIGRMTFNANWQGVSAQIRFIGWESKFDATYNIYYRTNGTLGRSGWSVECISNSNASGHKSLVLHEVSITATERVVDIWFKYPHNYMSGTRVIWETINGAYSRLDTTVQAISTLPASGASLVSSWISSSPNTHDHTSITGNASTATRATTADRLTTHKSITLTGDTTGSTTTDLSGNVTINTKSANRVAVNLINSAAHSRIVIGLCLVEPNNAHPASHAIGRLMRIRNNGNNVLGWYDVSFAKRHDTQRPDVTFLRAGTATPMRPCTFMYNGQKWAGLAFEINAQHHWLRFTGEASEEIFTIAYARNGHADALPAPNAILNAEINNSINFTDFNLQNRFEFNGTGVSLEGHTHTANQVGALPINGGALTGPLMTRKLSVTSHNGASGDAQIDIGVAGDFFTRFFARVTGNRTHFGIFDVDRGNTWLRYRGDHLTGRVYFENVDVAMNKTLSVTGNITAPRLIGNADTATRLQTPILFNGKAFDGSTNMEIQAQTPHIQITDWNNLSGLVTSAQDRDEIRVSSSNATNGPDGHRNLQGRYSRYDSNNGLLEVVPHTNGQPIVKYYRRFGGGQWGDWFTDSHEKPVWINLTPINGTAIHSPDSPPQYCKIGHVVHLRGAFTNILDRGTVCAILPEGFRPVDQHHHFVQNTTIGNNITYFARWSVNPEDGTIELSRINRTDGYVPGNWFPIHTSFVVG